MMQSGGCGLCLSRPEWWETRWWEEEMNFEVLVSTKQDFGHR